MRPLLTSSRRTKTRPNGLGSCGIWVSPSSVHSKRHTPNRCGPHGRTTWIAWEHPMAKPTAEEIQAFHDRLADALIHVSSEGTYRPLHLLLKGLQWTLGEIDTATLEEMLFMAHTIRRKQDTTRETNRSRQTGSKPVQNDVLKQALLRAGFQTSPQSHN